MNDDVMPAGTWEWLAQLGYTKEDIERHAAHFCAVDPTQGDMIGMPAFVRVIDEEFDARVSARTETMSAEDILARRMEAVCMAHADQATQEVK